MPRIMLAISLILLLVAALGAKPATAQNIVRGNAHLKVTPLKAA
jgi:hypothetical protein